MANDRSHQGTAGANHSSSSGGGGVGGPGGLAGNQSHHQGMFIRHRANAASVRLRRRKGVVSAGLDDDEQLFGQQQQPPPNNSNTGNILSSSKRLQNRFSGGDFEDNWNLEDQKSSSKRYGGYRSRPRAYSDDWDIGSDDLEDEFDDDLDVDAVEIGRSNKHRKSISGLTNNRRQQLLKCSPMETLDRRISVSTDQLDTLKRESRGNRGSQSKVQKQTKFNLEHSSYEEHPDYIHDSQRRGRARSVSRHLYQRNHHSAGPVGYTYGNSGIDNEFLMDYRQQQQHEDKMAANKGGSRYFFGGGSDAKSSGSKSSGGGGGSSGGGSSGNRGRAAIKSKLLLSSNGSSSRNKSVSDLFLGDEGPYSRRLYGPPPPELSGSSISKIDEDRKKRTRSHEHLMHSSEVGLNIIRN